MNPLDVLKHVLSWGGVGIALLAFRMDSRALNMAAIGLLSLAVLLRLYLRRRTAETNLPNEPPE